MLSNCWWRKEIVAILANIFLPISVSDVLVTVNWTKARAPFTWFICVTVRKMVDASQDEREATSNFIV